MKSWGFSILELELRAVGADALMKLGFLLRPPNKNIPASTPEQNVLRINGPSLLLPDLAQAKGVRV